MKAEDRLNELTDQYVADNREKIRGELLPILVAEGDHETVRHLLAEGTRTEGRHNNRTSLMIAAVMMPATTAHL